MIAALHVEELDEEYVCGMGEFFSCEQKRRGMLVPRPGFDGVRKSSEVGERSLAQKAEQVDVEKFTVELAVRSRSVKNDGLKIGACGSLEPGNEFVELLLWNHNFLLVPSLMGLVRLFYLFPGLTSWV